MTTTIPQFVCSICHCTIIGQLGSVCDDCVNEMDDETLTVEQYGAAIRDQFPEATSIAFDGAIEQTGDEGLMTFNSYGFRVSLTNGQQFDIIITAR